jgi:TetR/AcrR family transcriptional repressor of nem operon
MAMTKGGRPLAIQTQATQRILNAAQDLAQTRGFHGFSYADVAQELQVTKASLHYHFPAKADLGHALIARHHALFGKALESIDRQTHKAGKKLRRYVGLHDSVVRNNQLSLSGMLAAECATLPGPMQEELRLFFDANESWLAAVLEDGRRTGELAFRGSVRERARSVIGALEGAMLVARVYGRGKRFQSAANRLLSDLRAEHRVVACAPSSPAPDGEPATES